MPSINNTPENIEKCFASIERAAASGLRCPQNGDDGVYSNLAVSLAIAGRIKVEISGYNWRTVTILAGPRAGLSTKPDPKGGRIYKVVDAKGAHMIRKTEQPQRRQPSAPRVLTFNSDAATPAELHGLTSE